MRTRIRRHWFLALVGAMASGLAITFATSAQEIPKNCGTFEQPEPCPGTLPAIWPDKSAAWNNAVRVLGWNLDPGADYEVIVISPDGAATAVGIVTTDMEGDLLTDDGDGIGDPLHLLVGNVLGVYEVRAYVSPWSGDPNEAPAASTTFFHNNFGG